MGELGEFQRAIGAFENAIAIERTEAPLRAIERLANFEDRYARKLSSSTAAVGGEGLSPYELRERSIKRYQALIELGETVERLTGLGGVYKRQSYDKTSGNRYRKRLLREARKAYERAHLLALERNRRVDPFPTGNWLALRYLLGENPTVPMFRPCAMRPGKLRGTARKFGL